MLAKHLGIEFTEIGPDFLRGRMPVDDRTHQPYGILHGGASVALAETLGSYRRGTGRSIQTKYRCVGQEINANHVRAVSQRLRDRHGAPAAHRPTQPRLGNPHRRRAATLVCISRLTMCIMDRPSART